MLLTAIDLKLFIHTVSFVDVLRDHYLVSVSIMMFGLTVILYEQMQEPQTYKSVLSVVASGFHKCSDIANMD